MPSYIDHLVVTAPELEAGVRAVEKTLNVTMTPGGSHPVMGTHNSLLKLGDAMYLEVIAPDPAADGPPQPRWFGLDRLAPDAKPELTSWVVRTDDIRSALVNYEMLLGGITTMTRGNLEWQITTRADGEVPLDGLAPALIEWANGPHPAETLPDAGCSLADLRVFDPDPERLHGMLIDIGLELRPRLLWAEFEPAQLVAYINTPSGQRILGGPDSDLPVA